MTEMTYYSKSVNKLVENITNEIEQNIAKAHTSINYDRTWTEPGYLMSPVAGRSSQYSERDITSFINDVKRAVLSIYPNLIITTCNVYYIPLPFIKINEQLKLLSNAYALKFNIIFETKKKNECACS